MRISRKLHNASSRLLIALLAVTLAAAGPAPGRGAGMGSRTGEASAGRVLAHQNVLGRMLRPYSSDMVLSGGHYQLAAPQTASDPNGGRALRGGGYVLSVTGVLSDTSGCCCKSFLPCVRK